jgi:hypothetical protein
MKQKFYFMKVVVAVFGCMGALTTLFWMIAALEGVNLLSELAKSSILGKISLATMFGGMILTPFLWTASLIVDLQKKQRLPQKSFKANDYDGQGKQKYGYSDNVE